MSEALILAIIAALGGGGFASVIGAVLNRRNVNATAEVTVSGAWQKYAEELKAELAGLKGELKAAQQSIAVLERKRDEALYWQARITQREEIVAAILQAHDIPVPPMPAPPVLREPFTRATDREETHHA